jgi:endonuclease/exonuclease/phosphatase family metal-dependent hydrolase
MLFLIVLLTVFTLLFIAFYFWASSSTIESSTYSKVIQWKNNDKVNAQKQTYKIVSYNLGYLSGMTNNLAVDRTNNFFDKNMIKVMDRLEYHNPDFIAFQEIDYNSKRSFYVDQLETIASSVGYRFGAQQINWDKRYLPFPYWPIKHHFGKIVSGQAILSKYPILSDKRVLLQAPEAPFYRKAFYIDRLLQISKIDLGGTTLILMNLHLEAFDQTTRVVQAKKVLGLVRQYAKDYPVILAGDFNSDPIYSDVDNQDQEPTISFFLDAPEIFSASISGYPISKSKVQPTFPADNPVEKLDYIFYTADKIEILDFKVLKDFGTSSDHLPVLMGFRFK